MGIDESRKFHGLNEWVGEFVTHDKRALELIDQLRERGAVKISIGSISVEFAEPKQPVSAPQPEPKKDLTPEQQEAEDNKALFWSSNPVGT